MLTQQLLDRLVDGELQGQERKNLLEQLSREPDGWRRCACAFLEAQGWRESLGDVRNVYYTNEVLIDEPRPSPAVASHALEMDAAGRVRSKSRVPSQWFVLAACLLLAFGLGVTVDAWRTTESRQPTIVHKPATNETGGVAQNLLRPASLRTNVAKVMLADDKTGKPVEYSIPVLDGVAADENWLYNTMPRMPQSVVQYLKNAGLKVSQERELVPFKTTDGDSVIVPIDHVYFEPSDDNEPTEVSYQ